MESNPISSSFTATAGALAAGAAFAWSSPAEIPAINQTVFGFEVTPEQWSWVGSSATLGAALMCVFIGMLLDLVGRKASMLLLIVPFSVGWAFLLWPQNVYMLYFGRFSLGLAAGAFFVAAPVYIGEIASNENRGRLCSYFQLMVTVGILYVYVVGSFFNVFTFSVLCAIVPLLFGAIFVFMPETPHYYMQKEKQEDAIQSLKWLRGSDYDYTDDLNEMRAENEIARNRRTNLVEAMLMRATKRAFIISLALMAIMQFSGINAIIFYTEAIFDAAHAGISGSSASMLVGAMQVVATLVASMVVDRLGRRILLITSSSLMCLCNIAIGVYFYVLDHDAKTAATLGFLPIYALCLYIVAYSLGLGPVSWVLIGELFTAEVKGPASSASVTISWLLAFLVTKTFSNVRNLIGLGQTFWVFAFCSALGTIFVLLFVPETKGKSFVEIQRILGSDQPTEPNRSRQEPIIT